MSRRVVAPACSPAAELEQFDLQCQQLRLTWVAQTLPGTNTHVTHSPAAAYQYRCEKSSARRPKFPEPVNDADVTTVDNLLGTIGWLPMMPASVITNRFATR